jgi:hypothetical protein
MCVRAAVECYAIRSREFYNAVATLGQYAFAGHVQIGTDFLGLMQEVKRRHTLCCAAGDELDRCIEKASLEDGPQTLQERVRSVRSAH